MAGQPTLLKLVTDRVTHLARCSTCRQRLRTGSAEQLEVVRAQPVAQPYRLVTVPYPGEPRPEPAPYERERRRAA